MKRPKIYKNPRYKKDAINQCLQLPAISEILNPRDLCRLVIDLKVKDLSYHELEDFLARILHIPITQPEIEAILLAAGARAKHLNGIYDAQVQQKVKILEFDEIFQGRDNCYLGCADGQSHYLFMLERIANRNEETLHSILTAMGEQFDEVKVVITDGLYAYKSVVPECFEKAVHLLCMVHAFRIILRENEEGNRKVKVAYAALKKRRQELSQARAKMHTRRRTIRRRAQSIAIWKQKRKAHDRAHRIKVAGEKNVQLPERQRIARRLNHIRTQNRSQKKTLRRDDKEISKIQAIIVKAEADYSQKKQDALQSGRLVAEFKALLRSSPAEFALKKAQFERHLTGNRYFIAAKLCKFLRDHPEVFATKVLELDALCSLTMANTNIIEGIFGRIRPLLNKTRRFCPSKIASAFFEIVRFHYNLTPPYTGPNRCISPLERTGIHPRHRDYLDALFPPTREINCVCSQLIDPSRIIKSRALRFNARIKAILVSSA